MGLSSLFGGGQSAPSQPSPAPIYPINIPATLTAANELGVNQWNLSQDNWAQLYPGMVNAQNQEINQAYNALTGPLDPNLEKSFVDTGQGQALSAFGGGSEAPDITSTGSIGSNTVAASVAGQTQNYEDYARSWIDQLMADYPYPAQLGGSAAASLAGTNLSNELSGLNQARGFQANVNATNAQAANQQAGAIVQTGATTSAALLQGLASAGVISF